MMVFPIRIERALNVAMTAECFADKTKKPGEKAGRFASID
jgi:hypothetical protein